jgi:hypothetical protein
VKLAILLLAVTACNPILIAESPAPPGRSARLDPVVNGWGVTKSYRLELSQGTALAFSCADGTPCEHVTVTSDDPKIAEVRPASLGVLRTSPYSNQAQTAAAVVVVGHTAGATHLHLHAKEGERDVAVTVIPQPAAR